MTKLEAWKAWCNTAGTADLATEFTLARSSHGKAFSFAWDSQAKENESLRAELMEQSRVNGMGMEREARLLARIAELSK